MPKYPMMSHNSKMSKEEKAEYDKYQAESDLRTLVDAEEIRKDAKRLAAAKRVGHEQAAALRKVSAQKA